MPDRPRRPRRPFFDTSRGRAKLETRGLDSFTGVCFWVNTLRVSILEVSWEDRLGQFQKLWRGFPCKAFAEAKRQTCLGEVK